MEKISDYGVYTDGMRKSMADKTWFLGKIDGAEGIVDYGCADGALLQYISDAMPGVFDLTGIDIDEEMLKLASVNLKRDCDYPVSLCTPKEYVKTSHPSHNACLNCGSVIHEVYSYGTVDSIEAFWNFIFDSGFKYVAIRDMAISKVESKVADSVRQEAIDKIRFYNNEHPEAERRFSEFLSYYDIPNPYDMRWHDVIHYLLKYRYITNWNREMKEDYLPLCIEEVLLKIPDNYRVKYYTPYTLPFLKDQVLKDFGIDLNTKTHYKLLLERCE